MWARVGPWCPWASLCPPRGLTSFLGPSGWVPCHQSLHPSDLMRVFHRSPVRHTLKGLESTSLHYDSLQRPLWVGSAVPSGWVGHGTMRRGELVLCVAVPWLLGLVLLLLLLLVGRKFGDSLQDALFHSFSAPFDPPVKEDRSLGDGWTLVWISRIPFGHISACSFWQSPCFSEINCCQMQLIF